MSTCVSAVNTQKTGITQNLCIEYGISSDSQIDKPQHGHPKRAELLDVNINTGVKTIILRASLI